MYYFSMAETDSFRSWQNAFLLLYCLFHAYMRIVSDRKSCFIFSEEKLFALWTKNHKKKPKHITHAVSKQYITGPLFYYAPRGRSCWLFPLYTAGKSNKIYIIMLFVAEYIYNCFTACRHYTKIKSKKTGEHILNKQNSYSGANKLKLLQ